MATKTFKLRPKAESDLVDIYHYSLNEWGSARTDSYLRDLSNAFQQLADNHALGRDYSHVRPDLRAYSVLSHVIFYKPTSSTA